MNKAKFQIYKNSYNKDLMNNLNNNFKIKIHYNNQKYKKIF